MLGASKGWLFSSTPRQLLEDSPTTASSGRMSWVVL